MASHRGRPLGHIEVILIGVIAGLLSCGGGPDRRAPPGGPEQTAVGELAAGQTAPGAETAASEQARAAAYAAKAATYAQLASENRQALTALGASGPAAVKAARQSAAALADRLTAAAQKAADFHTQRASTITVASAVGTVTP